MRGRPVLGVVSGFLFGLATAFTLLLFGSLPTSSIWLVLLPILGVVLGLLMAWWAPFGNGDRGPRPRPRDISHAGLPAGGDAAEDERDRTPGEDPLDTAETGTDTENGD
jgi:hypothetical protein